MARAAVSWWRQHWPTASGLAAPCATRSPTAASESGLSQGDFGMRFKNLLAGFAAVMFAAPALAHHSFAMFDREKAATVSGIVKEYEWTNPHVWVHVMVPDANGKAFEWSFEMQSVA